MTMGEFREITQNAPDEMEIRIGMQGQVLGAVTADVLAVVQDCTEKEGYCVIMHG